MSSNSKQSGFILINKPSSFTEATEDKSGPTSHDVIDQLRKITGIKQIGHAGTLDPFASGLLLVGIGEATKLLRHYVGLDKKYEAMLRLGATSDTQDKTGKIQETRYKQDTITKLKIQQVIKSFIGKQKQVPPMYSAKKIGGKKLYELARKGQNIKREAVDIEIYDIKIVLPKFRNSEIPNYLKISCHVSSGTYIRTLAHDIGQALGCGAYLEELKRTAIGDFKLADAIAISTGSLDFARDSALRHLIPLKTVLVSGTFDGLHEGHINYFQQARKYGQRLICIVGRGKITEQIKGKPPRYSEKERVRFVKQCPEIDRVYLGILGDEDAIYNFTASLRPDVIALGYDQTAYTENLEKEMQKRGLTVKIVRLKPYKPKKYKSSLLNVY